MDCRDARRHLSAMVDEQLDPAWIDPLEEHLVGCPACGKAARLLEEVRHHFENLPKPAAPEDLTARVMARIAEPGARLRLLAPLLRITTAAAAAILLVTTAGIVFSPKTVPQAAPEVISRLDAENALELILSEIARDTAPPAALEEDR